MTSASERSTTDHSTAEVITYHFAVLRIVPHVYVGAYVPVGVLVHARTAEFLGMRVLTDPASIAARCRDVDAELVSRYLVSCEAICRGETGAGPVALVPPSERFHWLTAPRSDVIQSGPVHEGLTRDPASTLDSLFASYVSLSRNH